MTDWNRGMQQEFAYYLVDPSTWLDARRLDKVESCEVTRNGDPLRESANLRIDGLGDGEEIVRCYIVCTQDGRTERHVVGTWVVQTPKRTSDSRRRGVEATAYSPLIDLDDGMPPLGWPAAGGTKISAAIAGACSHGRAPYIIPDDLTTFDSGYSAAEDDTWLSYASSLAAKIGCEITCNGNGEVVAVPIPDAASSVAYRFDDDSMTSIILPDIEEECDWYSMPNRYEIVWNEVGGTVVGVAVNDDPASRISTVSRGRTVTIREVNPEELKAGCTQQQADELAARRLQEASAVERRILFRHGYCPVRVGDCVAIRHSALDLDVTAVVREQALRCETGCIIEATATYTEQLWRAQ